MQQQFSIMRKQEAMANGTYIATTRRRRKRKQSAVKDDWAAVNKQQLHSEEEAEEELDDEGLDFEYEEPYVDEAGNNEADQESIINGDRPSVPIRSVTDPISRLRPTKIVKFPNLPRSTSLRPPAIIVPLDAVEGSKASTDAELSERDSGSALNPHKRRKVSPDHVNGKTEMMTPDSPGPFLKLPGVMLDDDKIAQIQEILQQGQDKARYTSQRYEAEKAAQRRTFEAAISRANRRAHDAQEGLRQANFQNADNVKFKEAQFNEILRALKQDIENEQRQRKNNDDAYANQVTMLQNELQALKLRESTTGAADELRKSLVEMEGRNLQQAEQLKHYDQLRNGIGRELQLIQEKNNVAREDLEAVKASHEKLTGLIGTLDTDLDDVSLKTIKKYVQGIREENRDLIDRRERARQSGEQACIGVSEFAARYLHRDDVAPANGVSTNGDYRTELGMT
ncbi:MAG: hypothetical protein Q9187_004589 [Circinaria calcarea]